jgi:beta-phosphoglucomutase-like phosphatase (HAD superfamily)
LHHYFDELVCGGETARGKPHPDPYLRACNLLNVSPEECWALEDSMNGTRAALSAGLSVFQIPDLIEPQGPERDLGQEIVPSLLRVLAHWEMLLY